MTRYRCPGFIVKPLGGDSFEVSHAPRANIATTLDGKGLEYLIFFSDPATLEEAIAAFRGRGWELGDEVYGAVLEQLVAGRLLVAADEVAAPPPAVARAVGGIEEARPEDAVAIGALRQSLMTNLERPPGQVDAPVEVPPLSGAALVLLHVLTGGALRGEAGVRRASLARRFHARYTELEGLDAPLEELVAAGLARVDGERVALSTADPFPLHAALAAILGEDAEGLRETSVENVHLVARDGGAVVGYLEGRFLIHDHVATDAEVVTLIVAAAARGQGVGAELVRAMKRLTLERKVPRLRVPTQRNNTRAIAFYEREGFAVDELDVYLEWIAIAP